MRGIAAAFVVMSLALLGVEEATANDSSTLTSAYLQHNYLQDLMKKHFDISIDQLITSKQYGSQYVERPGLAKLLMEESDRHWEEGMETLKEYLQLGGLVNQHLKNKFKFDCNGELSLGEGEDHKTKYKGTLENLMKTSRDLVTRITNNYHHAVQVEGSNGDAEVARFLLDQVEEESKMAYKMASHITTYNSIWNKGVARDVFDENL